MEHVNEHMDELFRTAAASYQLRTEESGWEWIAAKLQEEPVSTSSKKTWRRLLVLLPLTVLIGIAVPTNRYRQVANEDKEILPFNEERSISGIDPGPEKKIAFQSIITVSDKSVRLSGHINQLPPNKIEPAIKLFPAPYDQNATDPTIRLRTDVDPATLISRTKGPLPVAKLNKVMTVQNSLGKLPVENKFYWGLTAGLEVNNVGLSSPTRSGFNAGILAGYQLSNKLSLESGLLVGSKRFICTGEAFSMQKLEASMPPGMDMEMVESSTRMWEVPIRLRYKVAGGKQPVSVTAAVNSAYQSKENNVYHASINGNKEIINAAYQPRQLYLLSSLQLSIAKEWQLSPGSSLRLEPFVKVPLAGIGMGNVPVNSAGLQVTILPFKR